MHKLQRVLERQIRELASGVLGEPERPPVDRPAEADVSMWGAVKNVCSLIVVTSATEVK